MTTLPNRDYAAMQIRQPKLLLLDLDGTPPSEKIRNLLNLRNEGMFDVEKAMEYGKSHGLDAVLTGILDEFETVKGKAILKGQLKFVRIAKGDVVDIPFSDGASGGGAAAEIAKAVASGAAGEETASLSLTTRSSRWRWAGTLTRRRPLRWSSCSPSTGLSSARLWARAGRSAVLPCFSSSSRRRSATTSSCSHTRSFAALRRLECNLQRFPRTTNYHLPTNRQKE